MCLSLLFEQHRLHRTFELFDERAGQARVDRPKQQQVQHHHQPQAHQVLGRLSLRAGVINRIVITLSMMKPSQIMAYITCR